MIRQGFAIVAALAMALSAGCTPKAPKSTEGEESLISHREEQKTRAQQVVDDMIDTWWTGTAAQGNVLPVRNGIYDENGGYMPWESAQLMSDLYTYWLIDGQPESGELVDRFRQQWNWTAERLGRNLTGNCGLGPPSPAVDDAAWNAMYAMMTYHVLKAPAVQAAARLTIENAYEAFKAAPPGAVDDTKDRSTENGLWYPQQPPSLGFETLRGEPDDNRFKSLYAAGLVMAALDILLLAKQDGRDWRSDPLWADTLGAYNWMEANLLRASADTVDSAGESGSVPTLPKTIEDGLQNGESYTMSVHLADNLYWTDYNVDRTGADAWGNKPGEKNGPDGGSRASLHIEEASSFSYLGGGMAMAISHARLYALTGEEKYLHRAVRTAQAFTDSPLYNRGGVLVNDRDAWNNGYFAGMYVQEVLSLPGIRSEDIELIVRTGESAFQKCRFTLTADMDLLNADDKRCQGKVFYRAEWGGGNAWTKNADSPTQPTQIMTSGSTANMILAGEYAKMLQDQSRLQSR